MFSDDDDMPLASQSSHNGITTNGHVATNGAGSGKARVFDADGDTPMSDVDDDDMPLVSSSTETYKVDPMLTGTMLLSRQSQVTRSTNAPAPSKRKRHPATVSDSSDDDDQPLALTSSPPKHRRTPAVTAPGARKNAATFPTPAVSTNGKVKPEDSDSDDKPLNNHVASSSKGRTKPKTVQKRKVKVEQSDEDLESEDDKPGPTKKAPQPRKKRKVGANGDANGQSVKKAAPRKAKKESGSEAEAAKPPAKKKGKAKKEEPEESSLKKDKPSEEDAGENGAKKGKGKEKKKEEETDDVYKWWEQDPDQTVVGDGTQKWTTLQHNGVIFPPPYQPLPSHVKMKYNSQLIHSLIWA
jgi:DNA topoisomerase-1